MTFDLQSLVRENIRDLKPYSSARSEFAGTAAVSLDANENAFGSPAGGGLNRYPDPLQKELKERIAALNNVLPTQIFVGNGSDEAIDLLFRIFCEPGRDEVIICPPTYGMYGVSANINDVAVREVQLTNDFQLDVAALLARMTDAAKLVFICSPNNPTGNLMRLESIVEIATKSKVIVVVDEAYIHFANEPSMIAKLADLPNLAILQTFSKAWGMAGARVGMAFASEPIIDLMNRVKPPYNVSGLAQQTVLAALDAEKKVTGWVAETLAERVRMERDLGKLEMVTRVYPSDANFLLVKVDDASATYDYLRQKKIVVRDRSSVRLCEDCLRITIGTPRENDVLIGAMRSFPA